MVAKVIKKQKEEMEKSYSKALKNFRDNGVGVQ